MYAYEFLARDRAGLLLAWNDVLKEFEWIGTFFQWQQVERLEREIVEGDDEVNFNHYSDNQI